MNGGKFDGNAVAFINALSGGIFADGVNGLNVVVVIAVGIFLSVGGFAQHIEGEAVAHFFALFAVLQRFFNGLSGNKLLAQQAHGVVHALADQGGAAFADEAVQSRTHLLVARRGQFAGNQQAPCGGVDEQGRAVVQMAFPVAFGNFVGNQAVSRRIVGNAQQSFRQTHQRNAFFAGERKLVHQRIHPAGFGAAGTNLRNQTAREFGRRPTLLVAHLGALQHILNGFDFVAAVSIGNRLAQWRLCRKSKVKHFKVLQSFYDDFQTTPSLFEVV